MATPDFTFSKIRGQIPVYLADADRALQSHLKTAGLSASFQDVYRASLFADSVLHGLSTNRLRPSSAGAISIIRRIPLLVSIGQSWVARTELRQFCELMLWTIYFTDHPVEWKRFTAASGTGFTRDQRLPISYAAHREAAFYLDYAEERMEEDPSGIGTTAVRQMKQVIRQLNAAVHPGRLARLPGGFPPFDSISDPEVRAFAKLQKQTFSSCCLVLAAFQLNRFNNLPAMGRSALEWLVGPKLKKELRAGPFGIPMAP